MINEQKIVDFEKYCQKCTHYPKSESECFNVYNWFSLL